MNTKDRIVPYDSDEAAQQRTVTGWVSGDGLFFGQDERTARYSGCTHRPCSSCGALTPKAWVLCEACRAKKDDAKWWARERRQWDGVAWLYSEARDEFYESPDDAENALDVGEVLGDLRLVICTPVYARTLDGEFFCDDLPEDGDLPGHVADAIDAFNAAIKDTVLSWEPGTFALDVDGKVPA